MGKFLKIVNFRYIFWFFLYFFIFCLLLRNSFGYLDPDFGWHLKVGQDIARTALVPQSNNFNYSFTGDWVDHEWLSNFVTFLVYEKSGYIVLSIAFALLVVFTLIILNFFVRSLRVPNSFFLISIFQVFGVVASLPHLGVRIQEIALLFLLLLLIILQSYTKKRRLYILLFLPLFIYLWACLHASFLIALFLLGAWLFIKNIEALIWRYWPKVWLDSAGVLSAKELLGATGIFFLSFVATLFTPYKLSLYSFLKGYGNTVYQSYIQEWLSQFFFPFYYGQLFYLALVTLALLLYLYYALARRKYFKINLWSLFIVILFIILSFKSRRHFPLMFIASLPFVVETYGILLGSFVKTGLNYWLKLFLFACLLLVSVAQLLQTKITNDPFLSFCNDYPCSAVKFLQARPDYYSQRLFNSYAWGGYFIWVDPRRSLFIDGRLPQVELAGQTYLEEYLDFFRSDIDIRAKLESYQIALVLIPTKEKDIKAENWEKIIFGIKEEDLRSRNYLREYLESSPDWSTLFKDDVSTIYVKK